MLEDLKIILEEQFSTKNSTKSDYLSFIGDKDDFGEEIDKSTGSVVYDAKTKFGSWAIMTPWSWSVNRYSNILGTGFGQKYQRQEDGNWLKIEG